ncbi:hypothetical protein FKW77_002713 [Venturia effusa]|uniref:F-box domain-containing protein n=1 Tax=Venturia effusa TaxID=50376 RepID=A0A517LIJ5_9PEZI|nr:hypothetical protein FKW77_002713 [Venturia effusa]
MAPKDYLSGLPEELLLQICQYLDCLALAHLVRVSKHFHRIAFPELYHHLRLVRREGGEIMGFMYLLPVLWKMIQQPELASLVQSLTVVGRNVDDVLYKPKGQADEIMFGPLPLPRGFQNDPAYLAAIDHGKIFYCGQSHEFWTMMESESSETSAIALLLTRLPNLRRLELWLPPNIWLLNGAIFDPLNRQDPNSSVFACLEEITLTGAEVSGIDWPVFLRLPALRRIYALYIGSGAFKAEGREKIYSSVTDIHIRECCLSSNELALILGACRQLETFVYELVRREVEDMMGNVFERPEWINCILQALLTYSKGTLQNLCLTNRSMGPVFLCYNQFPHLSFLKLSAVLVFGERSTMFRDEDDPDRPWNAEEAKRIYVGMIGAFPLSLKRLHITECVEIIKRERPTSVFTDFILGVPLEGFLELNLIDAAPGDSNGDVPIPSVVMKRAARIADACVRRDFEFELTMHRYDYYDYRKASGRGWGMQDEVRWNCEGEDLSEPTAYYTWNSERGEVEQLTNKFQAERCRGLRNKRRRIEEVEL